MKFNTRCKNVVTGISKNFIAFAVTSVLIGYQAHAEELQVPPGFYQNIHVFL